MTEDLEKRVAKLEVETAILKSAITELIGRDITSAHLSILLKEGDYQGATKQMNDLKTSALNLFDLLNSVSSR